MKPLLMIVPVLLAAPLAAQPGPRGCCMGGSPVAGTAAPVASNPVVDVTGTITAVHIERGQGMPYLEVKLGTIATKVYLGAMHFLIAKNFNPKAGQQVTAKGYKVENSAVVAIEVSLPGENQTLKLRDEKGWPLWRGGMRGAGFGPPAAR